MTPPRLRMLLPAALSLAVLAAAGCGGSSTTKPSGSTNAKSTSTPTSASGIPGKWSGQYGGAYSGTFKLSWKQSGSSLNGTIKLSTPARALPIHGKLNGSSIQFGTVGSLAITYSGTVSGSSMSGNYRAPGGGGSWSASKA